MSTHDRPRLTRRAAEQLLDDPGSSSSTLGRLLSAAGFPQAGSGEATSGHTPTSGPSPVDPARENAAVAAFVAARLAHSSTAGSETMTTTGRKAARRAVLATAALVSVTTGGFALAATGTLPILPDQASDRATDAVAQRGGTPASSSTDNASPTTSSDDTGSDTGTDSSSPATTDGAETETSAPTPNLEGLCKAFQAGDKSERGKSLESAAFAVLVAAAGGADNVSTYCVDLVGTPKPKPTKPTQAATPTKPVKPTQAATPTKPSKPTQAATPTKPVKPSNTGKPSDAGKPTDKGKPAGAGRR